MMFIPWLGAAPVVPPEACDIHWPSVVLLVQGGTDGSTTVQDLSDFGDSVTITADATFDDEHQVFGVNPIKVTSVQPIIPGFTSTGAGSRFARSTGDKWTIECWVYWETMENYSPSVPLWQWNNSTGRTFELRFVGDDGDLYLRNGDDSAILLGNIPANTLAFVQLNVDDTAYTIDLDGDEVGSGTNSLGVGSSGTQSFLVASYGGGSGTGPTTQAWVTPLRVTKGVNRARGSVPTDLFPTIACDTFPFTLFFGEESFPFDEMTGDPIVTGAPVTERAAFMALLDGASSEGFESYTHNTSVPQPVAITMNGTTCTVKQLLGEITEDLEDIHEVVNDPKIYGTTPIAGRFNTTSGGSKWLDLRVETGYDAEAPSGIWNGRSKAEFTFSTPIAAFGFYGTDFGDFSVGQRVLAELTDSEAATTVVEITDVSVHDDNNLIFWGFVDGEKTYTKVVIYVEQSAESAAEGLGIDDLIFCTPDYLA